MDRHTRKQNPHPQNIFLEREREKSLREESGLAGRLGPEACLYLKAHLLGLLGVHSGHVLVVPQGVPLLLLLGPQVAPQGRQNSLSLREGTKTVSADPKTSSPVCPHRYLHT